LVQFPNSRVVKLPNTPTNPWILAPFLAKIRDWHAPCIRFVAARRTGGQQERESKMSNQSKFSRALVATVAAVLMSSVTVGAAIGPAQAVAAPVKVSINA
jgi:hypothetical protein